MSVTDPVDALRQLSPADQQAVRRFVEDRFVNAVTLFAAYLRILEERPDSLVRLDLPQRGREAVTKLLDAVSEVRMLMMPESSHP